MTYEDEDIIKAIQSEGTEKRLGEKRLFYKFKDELERFAVRQYKLSKQDFTAIYTEAIRQAILKMESGNYDGLIQINWFAYILTIFKRRYVDHCRKEAAWHSHTQLMDKLPEQVRDIVAEIIAAKELKSKIEVCYSKLEKSCSKLLRLAQLGLTDKEISILLVFRTTNGAKQARYSCEKKLRECLKTFNYE